MSTIAAAGTPLVIVPLNGLRRWAEIVRVVSAGFDTTAVAVAQSGSSEDQPDIRQLFEAGCWRPATPTAVQVARRLAPNDAILIDRLEADAVATQQVPPSQLSTAFVAQTACRLHVARAVPTLQHMSAGDVLSWCAAMRPALESYLADTSAIITRSWHGDLGANIPGCKDDLGFLLDRRYDEFKIRAHRILRPPAGSTPLVFSLVTQGQHVSGRMTTRASLGRVVVSALRLTQRARFSRRPVYWVWD